MQETSFQPTNWGYNSAIVPWELSGSDKFRHDVFVLPQMLGSCFYSSHKGPLADVCRATLTDGWPLERRHGFVIHYSVTKDIANDLTKKYVMEHKSSSFYKLIEPYFSQIEVGLKCGETKWC